MSTLKFGLGSAARCHFVKSNLEYLLKCLPLFKDNVNGAIRAARNSVACLADVAPHLKCATTGACLCVLLHFALFCPGTSEQMRSKHILRKGAKWAHCEAAALWNVLLWQPNEQNSKSTRCHSFHNGCFPVSKLVSLNRLDKNVPSTASAFG